MDWKVWSRKYKDIAERLGIKIEDDRRAGAVLGELVGKSDSSELESVIKGRECIVFGAGPSLEVDLDRLSKVKWLEKVLIAADGATSAVRKYRTPDVIVTDLDGDVEDQLDAWRKGAWMVVHGHGDNIPKLKQVVPKLTERVLGTIQVDKPAQLTNFGGFTDGDRAAFMAHHLGASKIYLAGMDLGEEVGKYSRTPKNERKLMKLDICKDLLSWLAEEFGANIINLTSEGEEIPHVPHVEIPEES